MYAKDIYSPRRSPYVKPPRNYGGTAFSESPAAESEATPALTEPMPTPPEMSDPPIQSPPPDTPADEQPLTEPLAESVDAVAPPEDVPTDARIDRPTPPRGILSSLIPPLFGDTDSIGIGFEELLLVGLMFLVSQGERDTDTLLMLMLLLFYK